MCYRHLGSSRVIGTDVLVVGTEAAGARAAIAAREAGADVVAVSKYYRFRSGSTICAPSDYACDSRFLASLGCPGADSADSDESFYTDILAAGGNLNSPRLAARLVADCGQRLGDLLRYGARLGPVFRYPGHGFPRSLTLGSVGATGPHLMQILGRRADAIGVRGFDLCMLLDLIIDASEARGAVGLDLGSGELVIFQAKSVIVCAGGASSLYELSTAPEGATGDGIAMAYRAGAALVDMEMVQFIPYAQLTPTAMRGNTFLAGELLTLVRGHLLNRRGERFMEKYEPNNLERATRDEVSLAIAKEVAAGRGSPRGGAYVSLEHLDARELTNFLSEMFPKWRVGPFDLLRFGFDPSQGTLEIAPFAHYWCGGLRVDGLCQTSIPGLYAAGEAVGGIHGGNRLSGCSLTDTQVFGALAGIEAARWAAGSSKASRRLPSLDRVRHLIEQNLKRRLGGSESTIRDAVRKLAQRQVGVLRNEQGLLSTMKLSRTLRAQARGIRVRTQGLIGNLELVRAIETQNLIDILEVTALSANERTESRGAHFRTDFPQEGSVAQHTVVRQDGERAAVSLVNQEGTEHAS